MKLSVKISYILFTLVLCLAVLTGCDRTPAVVTEPETTAAPVTYRVKFSILGTTVNTQDLEQGQLPQCFTPELPGVSVLSWQDLNGNAADPFTSPVQGDTVYTALAYLQLRSHTPFLFADEQGLLHPEDVLTADELYAALQALAEPGAEKYFPGMPLGSQSVSVSTLRTVLESFFPADQIAAAFADTDTAVLRSQFAVGMLQLLGFETGELLTPAADASVPGDIPPAAQNTAYLLEASVAHTPDNAGASWDQLTLSGSYEPGFVNIQGYLYYVKEDGTFLCDGTIDSFTFGADGRYTSGDAELDAIVADIIKQIQGLNPDADRLDWLYSAYEYARDSFKYLGRNNHKQMGKSDWGAEEAKVMLTTQRGNCYNYAAAFWALARGLGYDAQVMSGVVLKDRQDHGWVFLYLDGVRYLCDPEWEMVYRYERDDYTKDMFMLTMDEIGWWNYDWTED